MKEKLENLLCKMHERTYCYLIGNGTTGLSICLQALGLQGRHIGIPNSVCINVPLAVLFSENRPYFLDIQLKDLGISPDEFYSHAKRLDAVIAVHGYGSICSISELEEISHNHGIPLIEDACLALGGYVGGRPIGSFGIASVISFGVGKPVNIGHGGAIFTDDPMLFQEIKTIGSKLPPFTIEADHMISMVGKQYTNLYNSHFGRDLSNHLLSFQKLAFNSKSYFLHQFNGKVQLFLIQTLNKLPEKISLRWSNLDRFSRNLLYAFPDTFQILHPSPGSVPWRLNLLMENRDTALKALHKEGLHASSWHPQASDFFDNCNHSSNTPISAKIGDKILNLWIDEEFNDTYLSTSIKIFQRILKMNANEI